MKLRLMITVMVPTSALLLDSSAIAAAPPTLGAEITFNGTLGGSIPVSGSVYDGNIHSGVFGVANGTSSDSYVLQGGDPYGGDTGDAYETGQAPGHVTLSSFFDIYTHYAFGQPASQVGTSINGNPDTGYATFVNNSGLVFQGTLDISGQAYGGSYGPAQFFDNNSGLITLAPGQSANIVLNDESSNYGGYNHPDAIRAPDGGASLGLLAFGLGGLGLFRPAHSETLTGWPTHGFEGRGRSCREGTR